MDKHSNTDRALRWLWSFPESTVILSRMSTLDQVKENVVLASNSKVNSLTEKELRIYPKISNII